MKWRSVFFIFKACLKVIILWFRPRLFQPSLEPNIIIHLLRIWHTWRRFSLNLHHQKLTFSPKQIGTWRPFASCLIDLAQQDDAKCVNMRTLRRSTYPCLSQTSSAVAFTCIYNNSAQLYHAFIWCLCVSSTPIVINEPFKHWFCIEKFSRPASWSIMLEHQRPVWLHQHLHSFWPFTSKIERSRFRIPRIHRKNAITVTEKKATWEDSEDSRPWPQGIVKVTQCLGEVFEVLRSTRSQRSRSTTSSELPNSSYPWPRVFG